MGLPSITRQVVWCLQALEAFGQSRHLSKQDGTAKRKLHARRTLRTYLPYLVRFANWARKEHGVRLLREIEHYMGEEYVSRLAGRGVSRRTLKTVVAALRKLETGIKVRFGADVRVLPEGFKAPVAGLDYRVRSYHVYTPDEVRQILEELDGEAALVAMAQVLTGLRVSEALGLKPEAIDLERRQVTVVGKGGRMRSVPLERPGALEFFRKLLEGSEKGKKLFKISARTVQAKVRAACLRRSIVPAGTHGFRKFYATSVLLDLLLQGLSANSAKKRVSGRLGHNRTGVLSHYIPRPPQRVARDRGWTC